MMAADEVIEPIPRLPEVADEFASVDHKPVQAMTEGGSKLVDVAQAELPVAAATDGASSRREPVSTESDLHSELAELETEEPEPVEPPFAGAAVAVPTEPIPHHPAVPVLPASPSELASFGVPGALRPVPGRLTTQPNDLLAHVPDTAIEWVDQSHLSMRGVSARGHVHRYDGSVRQDQLAVGQVGKAWVMSVADGLGSQPNSHLGAAFASRYAVQWAAVPQLLVSDSSTFSCVEVAGILQHEARRRDLDPKTVSTTLTFAVLNPLPNVDENGHGSWRVAVAQIGDSHAYLLRDGEWSMVTPRGDDTAMANVVDPLPRHTEASVEYLDALPGDVLALTSDGVGILLEDQPEFAAALAGLWATSAPSPAALLYVVDGAVKSYDDDRTFLGIRFGGE